MKPVVPAQAGIQFVALLGSRLHGSDCGWGLFQVNSFVSAGEMSDCGHAPIKRQIGSATGAVIGSEIGKSMENKR